MREPGVRDSSAGSHALRPRLLQKDEQRAERKTREDDQDVLDHGPDRSAKLLKKPGCSALDAGGLDKQVADHGD